MNFISLTVLMFLSCVFYAVQFGDMTPIATTTESGDPCNENSCTGGSTCHSSGLCQCHDPEGTSCQVECHFDPSHHNMGCHQNAECKHQNIWHFGLCICLEGYEGNGGACEEIQPLTPTTTNTTTTPTTTTTTNTTTTPAPPVCTDGLACDQNAHCLFNYLIGPNKCVCNNGFQGDGFTCEAVCTDDSHCGQNAHCLPNYLIGPNKCVCNNGFQGDGFTCEEIQPPT